MTLVTDYLLGGLAGTCAWKLFRKNRTGRQLSIQLWGTALAATAAASWSGGSYHGFGSAMPASTARMVWTATTLAMGAASFFLLAAVVVASFSGAVRRTLLGAAGIKLAGYSWWMLDHEAFVYVICEYGSTLLVVLALAAANRVRGESGTRAYLAGGVAVSIAAAALQQSGLRLHPHFNHNDLMHVVQMAAVWMLYQAGRRLRDADRRGDVGQS